MKNLLIIILCCLTTVCFAQNYFETREKIPEKYKWNLTDLCTDSTTWAKEYKDIEDLITDLSTKNREIKTAETLYNILYKKDSIYNEYLRLYLFAMMQEDINQNDELAQAMRIKMDYLESNYYDATAWINSAILLIDKDIVNQWFLSYNKLFAYKFYYKDLIRAQQHFLNEEKELTINLFNNAYYSILGVYDELFYSDMSYPTMKNKNININELDSTSDGKILKEDKRKQRIKKYKARADYFAKKKNTCAALISAKCQMDYAYAQAYGYKTSLQMDISSDCIPESVYTNVVETMKENTEPLKKYHRLRAKILKIDDYQSADMSCSIVNYSNKYDYEKAKIIIREALKPMGKEYLENLDIMLNNRRIDVYESNGKVSTVAYTVYTYGITPYILTTFKGKQKDMYDLIHELGHCVHAMLSMKNQPISNYEPSIFKDEITSTINELFLTDYLLKQAENPEDKIFALETAIKNMCFYYRRALEADFVYQLYFDIENEEPLTANYLDELYLNIFESFYGNSISNINASNWTKYGMVDFYDYTYVTSMTAAIIFHDRIISGSKKELNQYIDFLKSGGNDYRLSL